MVKPIKVQLAQYSAKSSNKGQTCPWVVPQGMSHLDFPIPIEL
jgi:hypothetical protein